MSSIIKPVITLLLIVFLKTILYSQFTDVSHLIGEENLHAYNQVIDEMPLRVSGGVASADINNDGYVDFIYSLGDHQTIKLLINEGGSNFKDRTLEYNLENFNFRSSSPHFFNLNNDDYIDLIVGSVDGTAPKLFKNIDGKKFELQDNIEFDILRDKNTITISSTDFNNDGLTDLFFSHWLEAFEQNHFWQNLGNGHFLSVDSILGFHSPFNTIDFCHTANFLDLNKDGFDDLLLCSDFGTSQIWMNDMGKEFVYNEEYNLSDENGMGSTIGDFDNDGDYDWFVTSVYDDDGILEGNWGGTGNKFYVNNGSGNFDEAAKELGIDDASWGWGTTFADLNNDGYLDIVVVNGWPQGSDQFKNDKLKIFMSEEGKFFTELAQELNIVDTLQGRGISLVDYNRDGCLDILTSNYRGPVKLYKNECIDASHFLALTIWESSKNPFGIGVEIEVYTGANQQTRSLSNTSNYLSQNPLEIHIGLKDYTKVDSIILHWNDNSTSRIYNIEADQHLQLKKPKETFNLEETKFILYPNPAQLNISAVINQTLAEGSKFYIQNAKGNTVKQINSFTTYKKKTYFDKVNISELPSGMYFLICDTNRKFSIPFIKI